MNKDTRSFIFMAGRKYIFLLTIIAFMLLVLAYSSLTMNDPKDIKEILLSLIEIIPWIFGALVGGNIGEHFADRKSSATKLAPKSSD